MTTPAFAQDEEEEETSSVEVSANVAMTTDYRFRGVSFSDEDFAIQGGFDVAHESGVYIGAWGSSLEDSALYGNAELDIYAGFATDLTDGLTFDIGLLYYLYPNGNDLAGDSDYFEPYASLSTTLGPVEASLGAAYAWDQSSLGGDNIYLFSDLGIGIPDSPISLTGHLGYSEGSLDYGSGGYIDWSLGAAASAGGLDFGIAYIDSDLPSVAGQDSAVVFTLGASF